MSLSRFAFAAGVAKAAASRVCCAADSLQNKSKHDAHLLFFHPQQCGFGRRLPTQIGRRHTKLNGLFHNRNELLGRRDFGLALEAARVQTQNPRRARRRQRLRLQIARFC